MTDEDLRLAVYSALATTGGVPPVTELAGRLRVGRLRDPAPGRRRAVSAGGHPVPIVRRGPVLGGGPCGAAGRRRGGARLDRGYARREPVAAADYFRSVGLTGPFWGS